MTRVVVTGAAGYLGGRLVAHLTAAGTTVCTVGREEAPPWLAPFGAQHARLDLSVDDASDAFTGADAVVHLAGANEVEASRDPDGALAGTVAATRRVAVAVAAVGVPRLVYVSTVHVYGAALAEDAEISEATVPAPRHPYAISRLASEHTAAAAVAGDALVVFRLTNAVGAPAAPRVDRWSLLVNDLCRQAVNVGTVTLKSAGDQWRDFIPATDAISAIASAAEAGRVPAGTYNLGSGRPRTVRDVAMLVQDAFEARTGERPPLIAPDPSGPAPRPYRVDIGRLAAQGLAPKSDLPVAIDETAAFCLEHRAALEG